MIYIAVFPVMIFILITLWLMELPEKARMRRYAEERETRLAKERIEYEIRQAKEKKEAEEREAKRQKEFNAALNSGIDVCKQCEAIQPKRCSNPRCRKCLESYKCGGSEIDNSGLCKECYWTERRKICHEAESRGIVVCRECVTVKPPRFACGHCKNCNTCKWCGCCLVCDGYNYSGLCYRCEQDANSDD